MDDKHQKSLPESGRKQGTRKPDSAKSKRLSEALRHNLARRKEAQKSRPHRLTTSQES